MRFPALSFCSGYCSTSSGSKSLKSYVIIFGWRSFILSGAQSFSLSASFTATISYGSGFLEDRSPVRGIFTVDAKETAAVKLCTSFSTFSHKFISIQAVLKPVQTARPTRHPVSYTHLIPPELIKRKVSFQVGDIISCFYWRNPANNVVCKTARAVLCTKRTLEPSAPE